MKSTPFAHRLGFTLSQDARVGLLTVGMLVVAALILPATIVSKLDLVGYAVCHRISDRSFIIGGTQLPMCARDTGMFGSTLLCVLGCLVVRPARVAKFPQLRFWPVLVAFGLMWAADGFNSYMLLATGRVFYYVPLNSVRLLTGALMGVALASFVLPFFNEAVWSPKIRGNEPVIQSWGTLLILVFIALAWVAFVLWQPGVLYGAYALISTLGTVMLLSIVNSLVVVLLTHRENTLVSWRQFTLPFLIGVTLSVGEIAAIGALRSFITARMNLPF